MTITENLKLIIKKEKEDGMLNSEIMKKYELTYPQLREILDESNDENN